LAITSFREPRRDARSVPLSGGRDALAVEPVTT
jgi:hypothetical protein